MNKLLLVGWLMASGVLITGCRTVNDRVIIKGNLAGSRINIEGRKVYLYDLAYSTPKDSSVVLNSTFYFEFAADSSFTPFSAKLSYTDTLRDEGMLKYLQVDSFLVYHRPIGFTNPYMVKAIESGFYVDRGTTIVSVDNTLTFNLNGGLICSIAPGSQQNETHFRHIEPWPHRPDSIGQKKALDHNILLVKKYPFSADLLASFYFNKDVYPTAELKQLTALFDNNLKKSSLYKKFTDYFVYKDSGAGESPDDLVLLNADGKRAFVVNRHARLNMFVFWASWCGPCRKEIPALKALVTNYSARGLCLSSISIDTDSSAWRAALAKEQMTWNQFLVLEADKVMIENKYNVHAVPVAFLVDRNNRVVEKILNLDTAAIKKIEKYISL